MKLDSGIEGTTLQLLGHVPTVVSDRPVCDNNVLALQTRLRVLHGRNVDHFALVARSSPPSTRSLGCWVGPRAGSSRSDSYVLGFGIRTGFDIQ